MPKRTEKRLRDLCEQAIAANESEVERKTSELRVALEEHISAAKESLSIQASVIPVLDSIACVSLRPILKGGVTTNDVQKYPWQSPVSEAFREFNADQMLGKISTAENAVAKRLLELNGAADHAEETQALHDAQNTLATLKRPR